MPLLRPYAAACHQGGRNVVAAEKTLDKAALEKYLDGGFNVDAIIYQAGSARAFDTIEVGIDSRSISRRGVGGTGALCGGARVQLGPFRSVALAAVSPVEHMKAVSSSTAVTSVSPWLYAICGWRESAHVIPCA